MNEQIASQVSAFVDDELPEAECELLVRRLSSEPDVERAARRYLLMGQALRGEFAGTGAQAMARRISEALAHEPPAAPVVGAAARRPGWLRPLAGAGVAAAVALAAVLLLQGGGPGGPGSPGGMPAEAPAAGRGAGAYTVTPVSSGQRSGGVDEAPAPAMSAPVRLTNYLMSHGEVAGSLGRKSIQIGIVGTSAAELMGGSVEVMRESAPETAPQTGEVSRDDDTGQ